MDNKEAIKYLIAPVATSTEPSAEYLKQKEAYELAIKALERPQGEWLRRVEIFDDEESPRLVWGCKDCGFSLKSIHDKRNYCPNCGTKMKGGAE